MRSVPLFPSLWPVLCQSATGKPWPPRTPEDAETFVRRAHAEQLLPLLFADEGQPEIVRRALDAARPVYLAHGARAAAIGETLERVGELVAGAGTEFIVLKGCDFAYRLYPQPHLRPVADIDLLVREMDMRRTIGRLVDAGFVHFYPGGVATRVPSHHEAALGSGNVVIDLHQRLVPSARHRIDYEGLWKRAVRFESSRLTALRLSDADAAAYLTLSIALKNFRGPLIRYVDLWLLLRANPKCLEQAAELSAAWQARHAFYAALQYGARLFPELQSQFGGSMDRSLGRSGRALLDRWVIPRDLVNGTGLSRAEHLWCKFWLMDNVRRRSRFAAEHAVATMRGYFLAHR